MKRAYLFAWAAFLGLFISSCAGVGSSGAAIQLRFTEVPPPEAVSIVGDPAAADMLKEQPVEEGSFVIYTKNDDRDNAYVGFRAEDAFYEIGILAGANYDPKLMNAAYEQAFGKRVFVLSGPTGAKSGKFYFVEIVDDRPVILASLSGNGVNVVGQGGDARIVLTYFDGPRIDATIYRLRDGLERAVVGQAVPAQSVHFRSDRIFEIRSLTGGVSAYKLSEDTLREVDM
ncbi:MAG TPA: hypothetical protein VEZ72_03395 [Paenibacillus sp.]|nr:hypothetical protein [Paenibacillus sp.]